MSIHVYAKYECTLLVWHWAQCPLWTNVFIPQVVYITFYLSWVGLFKLPNYNTEQWFTKVCVTYLFYTAPQHFCTGSCKIVQMKSFSISQFFEILPIFHTLSWFAPVSLALNSPCLLGPSSATSGGFSFILFLLFLSQLLSPICIMWYIANISGCSFHMLFKNNGITFLQNNISDSTQRRFFVVWFSF